MDIRQWLQNTADREPPDEHVERGFPDFLRPKPDAVQSVRRSRQKRKRASSDPLVPAHRPSRARRDYVQPSSSEQARATGKEPAASSSRSSASSSSSDSQQSAVSVRSRGPIETFQRRLRHKTRPERYESKPKHRKEKKSSHKKKSESRRRKSHRNGDGARTTGLVQSFQLKNGPKSQRLTLKPDASAGIFKNGRASGPVATSGPGLPDLVFNEMRFLRRPKEHQDELPANDSSKQSKKTRKQIQEEEISTYFNRNASPGKRAGLGNTDTVQPPPVHEISVQRAPEIALGPPKHPIELPEKPFLGFGSRGPPQEGIESQLPSDSCYTWSESVPVKQSLPPSRTTTPVFGPAVGRSQGRDMQPNQLSTMSLPPSKASLANPQQQQSNPPAANQGRVSSRRGEAPACMKTFPAPRALQQHSIAAVDVSSESLLGVMSESKIAELEEMDDRWEMGSYHTSDILKIRDTSNQAGRPQSFVGAARTEALADKENNNPITSTPTSERLRHAFGAVTKSKRTPLVNTPASHSHSGREERTYARSTSPAVQRGQSRGQLEVVPSPPRWEMPQRGFSRTSDANGSQYRPLSRLATATRPTSTQQWQVGPPRPASRLDAAVLPDAPPIRLPDSPRDYMHTNSREAEALVHRLESDQVNRFPRQHSIDHHSPVNLCESPVYPEELMEPEAYIEPVSFEPELFSLHSQLLGNEISEKQFFDERDAVNGALRSQNFNHGRQEAVPVTPNLVGFWKPNILY